ncbi:hypothetical protein DPMN_048059 [Dreissena polymorpha]|uniref:Uncharacterized protein n=1 Tax=Dreissena polymorpha TaxID=45954 RepID=A0A9D4DAJ0_DREPO|nr:hypothetical protein DPMN_048059 [Dreissena polymorpha]
MIGRVAFFAYLNHSVPNLGPDGVIQFRCVFLNEGNASNTHTGVFTVPCFGGQSLAPRLHYIVCESKERQLCMEIGWCILLSTP